MVYVISTHRARARLQPRVSARNGIEARRRAGLGGPSWAPLEWWRWVIKKSMVISKFKTCSARNSVARPKLFISSSFYEVT